MNGMNHVLRHVAQLVHFGEFYLFYFLKEFARSTCKLIDETKLSVCETNLHNNTILLDRRIKKRKCVYYSNL